MASGDLLGHAAPHPRSTLIRLTQLNGRPVYINPPHILAVRPIEEHEAVGLNIPEGTTRVDVLGRSYNVIESIGYVVSHFNQASEDQ